MRTNSVDYAWQKALSAVILTGLKVAPRGKPTLELMQQTVTIDMRRPVLLTPARKLNYKFMAAEAYWILSGSDSVSDIAPWNKNISAFSDDGVTFFGAYGPKILSQLDYVVNRLRVDPDSRQAGLTIWRENPPATKDVPCTVAIFANIRDGQLNLSVYMRSSDLWLGLPYDIFNFSMLAHLICANLPGQLEGVTISPGNLYVTAFSSHLYKENMLAASECLKALTIPDQSPTPDFMHQSMDDLLVRLAKLRDSSPGDANRWWES